MAKVRRYREKDGLYVVMNFQYRSQTLQVSTSANDFLHRLNYNADDTHLPLTILKALIHTGDFSTKKGGPTRPELLEKLPELSPQKCRLDDTQQQTLQAFLQSRVKSLSKETYHDLNDFLINETPLEMLSWAESTSENGSADSLDSIAREFF